MNHGIEFTECWSDSLRFDAVVVGASSAGLFAAERLARGGLHVAVFDRADRLAPSRRTLIITPEIRRFLGDLPGSLILHRTARMAVVTRHASAEVSLPDPDLIIERSTLARHLEARALSAGATLFFGHRFQSATPTPGGARLEFWTTAGAAVTIEAGAIVGADGAFSRVAAETSLQRPATVPILQAEVQIPPSWDPAVTRVWFDVDDTRFFYWFVPESLDRGVVGLIGDSRPAMRRRLEGFLQKQAIDVIAFQGARVAMHHPRLRPWTQIGSAPVLLVGDAAGQVKVTTVGGTVTGLWGADAAARSLLGTTSYAQALRGLKRELDVHWALRLLLERLDNRGYDRLVRALSPGVARFLATNNRDRIGSALWKFPFYEAPLLLLGLDLLVRRNQTPPALSLDRSDG